MPPGALSGRHDGFPGCSSVQAGNPDRGWSMIAPPQAEFSHSACVVPIGQCIYRGCHFGCSGGLDAPAGLEPVIARTKTACLTIRRRGITCMLADGNGCPAWIRTTIDGFRVRSLTIRRQGIISMSDELDAPVGLEPTTFALRTRCATYLRHGASVALRGTTITA